MLSIFATPMKNLFCFDFVTAASMTNVSNDENTMPRREVDGTAKIIGPYTETKRRTMQLWNSYPVLAFPRSSGAALPNPGVLRVGSRAKTAALNRLASQPEPNVKKTFAIRLIENCHSVEPWVSPRALERKTFLLRRALRHSEKKWPIIGTLHHNPCRPSWKIVTLSSSPMFFYQLSIRCLKQLLDVPDMQIRWKESKRNTQYDRYLGLLQFVPNNSKYVLQFG